MIYIFVSFCRAMLLNISQISHGGASTGIWYRHCQHC